MEAKDKACVRLTKILGLPPLVMYASGAGTAIRRSITDWSGICHRGSIGIISAALVIIPVVLRTASSPSSACQPAASEPPLTGWLSPLRGASDLRVGAPSYITLRCIPIFFFTLSTTNRQPSPLRWGTTCYHLASVLIVEQLTS